MFYNKPEFCAYRWSRFASAKGSLTAVSTSTTVASIAVAITLVARAPGVRHDHALHDHVRHDHALHDHALHDHALHDHALAAELPAVQPVHGVAVIVGVLELHEAVPLFKVYFEKAAIATEKALDVLLPDVVAQASYVDAWHVRGGRGARGPAVERRTAETEAAGRGRGRREPGQAPPTAAASGSSHTISFMYFWLFTFFIALWLSAPHTVGQFKTCT